MSQWAHNNPEQMAEIAALPPSQQNEALRAAIGYDPDEIRDRLEEEEAFACEDPLGAYEDDTVPPEFKKCSGCGCQYRGDAGCPLCGGSSE